MSSVTYGQAALPIASREVGVKENPAGSNTGPRVKVYLQGHPPEPWCADFVTWVLKQAGFPQPTWNWSYCPSWAAAAASETAGMRPLTKDEIPQDGDLALYDWGHDGVPDHIGIVKSVLAGRPVAFTAIEGNTAIGNDSNGGQVLERQRNRGDVHMFIRLPKRPAPTLAERLRAAGYGAKTVPVILRNLKEGIRGNIAHPSDRQMYRNLRKQGLSPASANAVVKSTRKKNP